MADEENSTAEAQQVANEVPDEPASVPRADKEAHEAKVAEINKTIEGLKEKNERLRGRIDGVKKSNDEMKGKIDEARAKFQAEREAQQKIKLTRQQLMDARDGIRAAQQKASDAAKSAKRSTPYANVESIEQRLAQLSLRQNTENMSLASERDLVREIETLKQQRGNLKSAQDALARAEVEADSVKTTGKDANEKITKLTEELKEASATLKVAYEALKALEEQRGARGAMSELIKERDEVRAETDAAYNALRKQNDEFRATAAAHGAYVAAHRRWKAQVAAKERAARGETGGAGTVPEEGEVEGAAAAGGGEEGEEGASHAYAHEQSLCDNLARYLSSLLPKEDHSAKHAAEAAAREAANAAAVLSFTQGLKGKEKVKVKQEEDEFAALTVGKNKKKQGKQVKADAAPALTSLPPLGLAELTAFRLLDITPPVNTAELEAKIGEIKAKRVWYDTAPAVKPAGAASEEREERGEGYAGRGMAGRGRGRGRGGFSRGEGRPEAGSNAAASADVPA